ncbi:ABC transporter ATP-binding protein [Microaerobacter geothermalis]|uniref:ABC transporter ATP-binding protein n=1 Tax=Microaerobacter geothermalis TaxID=674972 RepID=UPI001F1A9EEC|nr:ABC transporter ATP-binding protein [Microaerobacter geothermalis]MCF6093729.1 ABC transporter ATP-binding protein [Microaerobacter geothermalis]
MGLQINQLSKSFLQKDGKELLVLDRINLTINHGEFVSFLGPSGCGKSTLLNIIAGLDQASDGEVVLDGKRIEKPGIDRGVVFQEAALFPWLTVLENVIFALRSKKLSKKEAEDVAMAHLRTVHLSRFAKSYPHELSGGMKQRVSIARALALDPKILLMDEPFGALDEQTRMVLHRELQDIWFNTKKTILFVTHNIREAVQLSDRVLVFGTRPGNIKEEFQVKAGRPREIGDRLLLHLEEKIMDVLAEEIEKVVKEEMGHDYRIKENRVPWSVDRDMGSHI